MAAADLEGAVADLEGAVAAVEAAMEGTAGERMRIFANRKGLRTARHCMMSCLLAGTHQSGGKWPFINRDRSMGRLRICPPKRKTKPADFGLKTAGTAPPECLMVAGDAVPRHTRCEGFSERFVPGAYIRRVDSYHGNVAAVLATVITAAVEVVTKRSGSELMTDTLSDVHANPETHPELVHAMAQVVVPSIGARLVTYPPA